MEYYEIKSLKAQVEHVLQHRPETRNSDAELIQVVCGMFREKGGAPYDPIKRATSIERCRRWFNQRKKYLPTNPEVARQRRINTDEWLPALGYPTTSGGWKAPSQEKKSFRFPSDTKRGIFYEVMDLGAYITCNCPSFQFRKICKHSKTVLEAQRQRSMASLF